MRHKVWRQRRRRLNLNWILCHQHMARRVSSFNDAGKKCLKKDI